MSYAPSQPQDSLRERQGEVVSRHNWSGRQRLLRARGEPGSRHSFCQ